MIQKAIQKLVDKENLTQKEAEDVMNQIMEGKATQAQIGSFLTALRMKGETIDEITACAKVMREKASTIHPKVDMLVDTCGTGGDKSHSFNISTTAAFVVAGAGIPVAKHGNKSVSSHCGSADVLKQLGVNLDLTPKQVEKCIEEIGIGFMFAPIFHGAMKHAIGPRKELGIRTIFNILGPLTNPANAKAQVVGVFDPKLTEPLAEVLGNLGLKHAFVVHGNGLDEITIDGETRISEYKQDQVLTYNIKPTDFGIKISSLDTIKTNSIEENAEILIEILKGVIGPQRDIVILNAA
ncbi:MAG: anthranilate phosphoribosyltransferase, partial [archaeon]